MEPPDPLPPRRRQAREEREVKIRKKDLLGGDLAPSELSKWLLAQQRKNPAWSAADLLRAARASPVFREDAARLNEVDLSLWRRQQRLTYKRVQKDHTEHDLQRIRDLRERFVELQRTLPAEHLTFIDEFTVALNDVPRYAWTERGKPAHVKAPERRQILTHVIAAITWHDRAPVVYAEVIPPAKASVVRDLRSEDPKDRRKGEQALERLLQRHNMDLPGLDVAKILGGDQRMQAIEESALDELEPAGGIEAEDIPPEGLPESQAEGGFVRPFRTVDAAWWAQIEEWQKLNEFPKVLSAVSQQRPEDAWAILRARWGKALGRSETVDEATDKLLRRLRIRPPDGKRDAIMARLMTHLFDTSSLGIANDPELHMSLLSEKARPKWEALLRDTWAAWSGWAAQNGVAEDSVLDRRPLRFRSSEVFQDDFRRARTALALLLSDNDTRAHLQGAPRGGRRGRRRMEPDAAEWKLVQGAARGVVADNVRFHDELGGQGNLSKILLRRAAERLESICVAPTLSPWEKARFHHDLDVSAKSKDANAAILLEKVWMIAFFYGRRGTDEEREAWVRNARFSHKAGKACPARALRGEGGVASVPIDSRMMVGFFRRMLRHTYGQSFLVGAQPKTVLMDNASWHLDEGIPRVIGGFQRRQTDEAGAPFLRADGRIETTVRHPPVLFTPPYSPEFNPIEKAIGLCKRSVRKWMLEGNARSRFTVSLLIRKALEQITPDSVRNLILCSGYPETARALQPLAGPRWTPCRSRFERFPRKNAPGPALEDHEPPGSRESAQSARTVRSARSEAPPPPEADPVVEEALGLWNSMGYALRRR